MNRLFDPYEHEIPVIEAKQTRKIKGYTAHVYYAYPSWHVWIKGKGEIGYSLLNKEAAIADARKRLEETR